MNRMRAAAGLFGVAQVSGLVSPDYAAFQPRGGTNTAYLLHLFRISPLAAVFRAESKGLGTGESGFLRLYTDRFGRIPVPQPPPDEQQLIVRFLDWHGSRMAALIRAKRNVLALLNEEKQAIMRGAVTRGLLDAGGRARHSDSHVDGLIPDGWTPTKIRNCGRIVGGMTPSIERPEFWNGDIPWVTPKDIKADALADSKLRVTSAALEQTSLRKVPPGSVLLVVRGMILSRKVPVARAVRPLTINQDIKAIVPFDGIWSEFLQLRLQSAHREFAFLIDEAGHGTRRFPTERWRDVTIAMPPLDEQKRIANWAISRLVDEERAQSGIEREIALLQDFRTRLVADVATGKLDVRAFATGLPEVGTTDTFKDEVYDEEFEDETDEASETEEAA
jgi:type I restriction enzyme S subunit